VILLVAENNAITPMYGELARDFGLLEAGYIGQLLMTEARSHELGLCPIGHIKAEPVQASLGLTGSQELIHSLVGGRIKLEQERRWLGAEEGGGHRRRVEDDLRDHIASKLPGYMIPSAIVLLESMPLTANGKVDRKTLTERAGKRELSAAPAERPQTDLERMIGEMVGEVMKITDAGVTQNLFDLGRELDRRRQAATQTQGRIGQGDSDSRNISQSYHSRVSQISG
jgi:hypothetical protein